MNRTRDKQTEAEKAESINRAQNIAATLQNPKYAQATYALLLKCNAAEPTTNAFALSIIKSLAKRYGIKGDSW